MCREYFWEQTYCLCLEVWVPWNPNFRGQTPSNKPTISFNFLIILFKFLFRYVFVIIGIKVKLQSKEQILLIEEWLKLIQKMMEFIILEQKKFIFKFNEILVKISRMWETKLTSSSMGYAKGELVLKHEEDV